jgi:uncharacterized protein YndB with AHSA1/START domain
MSDYWKTVRAHATPDALFDAVTTADGLSAWWTRTEGAGGAGGELRFFMSAPDPLLVFVDAATRPTSVRWTVTECTFEPEWVGTHPTFTITPVDDTTCELTFTHVGLTDELECIEMCTRGWDHYLASLRAYVESGSGNPRGSEADLARRTV